MSSHRRYEEVFRLFYPKLVGYFSRRAKSREVVEDLAQKTLLRVFRGMDGFRGDATHSTWIYRIAKNVLLNERRYFETKKRKAQVVSFDSSGTDDAAGPELALDEPSPEEELLRKEEIERLHLAIGTLPARMKETVLLSLGDLDNRTIAKAMQVSENTVKKHLYDAREKLGAELAGAPGEAAASVIRKLEVGADG